MECMYVPAVEQELCVFWLSVLLFSPYYTAWHPWSWNSAVFLPGTWNE